MQHATLAVCTAVCRAKAAELAESLALAQSFRQPDPFSKGKLGFPGGFGHFRRKLDPSLFKIEMALFTGNLTRFGGGNLRETGRGNLALFRGKL